MDKNSIIEAISSMTDKKALRTIMVVAESRLHEIEHQGTPGGTKAEAGWVPVPDKKDE